MVDKFGVFFQLTKELCLLGERIRGLLKALAIIRLISTPVLFLTHMDLSHWIAWSGSVGFSQASSSSQMWSGGGGRINSGRKWLSIGGFGPLTKASVI